MNKFVVNDLTVSYETAKKENAVLKSSKWNLENENNLLGKEWNDQKLQINNIKSHCSDLEAQVKNLKALLDRLQTFKACIGNLGIILLMKVHR